MSVEQYLIEKGWRYKNAKTQWTLESCPICNKNKFHKFYINKENGLWYCQVCTEKGNLDQLKRKMGDLKEFSSIGDHFGKPKTAKDYITPEKDKDNVYHEALLKNEKAMEYLTKVRCFTEDTIKRFKIGFVNKTTVDCFAIPYYENGYLVNFKFRSIPPSKKIFLREKDCKSILWNVDSVKDLKKLPKDRRIIVVTESETDAMALCQFGLKQVVSSSIGAGGVKEDWNNAFDVAEKIYIFFDNDPAGEAGAKKLASALGRYRCFRVYPKMHDIAEMQQCGMGKKDIVECIKNAKSMDDHSIKEIGSFFDDIIADRSNPEPRGKSTGWKSFDSVIGGLRDSELIVITGPTGSGKSTFTTEMSLNISRTGSPVLICPFEQKAKEVAKKIISMTADCIWYEIGEERLAKTFMSVASLPILFLDHYGKIALNRLKDVVYSAVKQRGVGLAVIDHLHFALEVKNHKDERVIIGNAMVEIKAWAEDLEIPIALVVQPKKIPVDQSGNIRPVDLSDLRGAAEIEQTSDTVVRVHRHRNIDRTEEPGVTITVLKCRSSSGTEGSVELGFKPGSERYFEKSPLEDDQYPEQTSIRGTNPDDAF
jgi:twinkle protein